jgi:hypothetical protein
MRPGDDRVSRALTQLPALRAPGTLLPRVMAAVQAWAGRPWYQRAWFTWPMGWQLATVGALVLMAVSTWEWAPALDVAALFARLMPAAPQPLSPQTASSLSALRVAAGVLWQGLQPILVVAFVIVVAMAAACLAAAVALNRAVFGRTQHS